MVNDNNEEIELENPKDFFDEDSTTTVYHLKMHIAKLDIDYDSIRVNILREFRLISPVDDFELLETDKIKVKLLNCKTKEISMRSGSDNVNKDIINYLNDLEILSIEDIDKILIIYGYSDSNVKRIIYEKIKLNFDVDILDIIFIRDLKPKMTETKLDFTKATFKEVLLELANDEICINDLSLFTYLELLNVANFGYIIIYLFRDLHDVCVNKLIYNYITDKDLLRSKIRCIFLNKVENIMKELITPFIGRFDMTDIELANIILKYFTGLYNTYGFLEVNTSNILLNQFSMSVILMMNIELFINREYNTHKRVKQVLSN